MSTARGFENPPLEAFRGPAYFSPPIQKGKLTFWNATIGHPNAVIAVECSHLDGDPKSLWGAKLTVTLKPPSPRGEELPGTIAPTKTIIHAPHERRSPFRVSVASPGEARTSVSMKESHPDALYLQDVFRRIFPDMKLDGRASAEDRSIFEKLRKALSDRYEER